MESATFQYKCRRCGAIYDEGHTGKEFAQYVLLSVISGSKVKLQIGNRPELLNVHSCGAPYHGEGVSDLIGYKVYDDVV